MTQPSVAVSVAIAEIDGPWCKCFPLVAEEAGVPATVEPRPGSVAIRVDVSLGATREDIFGLLDAALGLVETAKIKARQRSEAAERTEAWVRQWFAERRG